jgi:hypothetical protein
MYVYKPEYEYIEQHCCLAWDTMSASQRTAIAGYLDSSEDEKALREIPLGQLGNKKTKVNSTALPRLSGSSHTTLPGFRFPQSGSSARGPVPPTGRLPSQPHGPTSEPGTSSRPVVSTAAKSSMAIPSTLLNQEHSRMFHNYIALSRSTYRL